MANNYKTIKTNAGLALETAAQAGGNKITLTQMAIGDGGGNVVTPSATQTGLVREHVRVSLNAIAVDPDNSNQFTAEAIIPASAGGFTMREAGLYTADGMLFAVANLPQVYKPSSSEGSFGQVVITMTFQAANSDEVNLSVDENVSVATRLWVENYVIPEHVFKGGTTGQFLAKSANTDGAWTWVDPSASVRVLVDTVEEDQTLASGQTTITLSKVTANGLGVFVNGVRLRDDEWSKVDETHISLNSARNSGDKITLLQNEQTGYSDVLRADRNLSDVDDVDVALKNLSGLSTNGGRMEGLFAVDSGLIYANRAAGSDRGLMMQTNGIDRFSIVAANDGESGSNTGSSFRVNRYDDAGKFIDAPLTIDRATGTVSVAEALYVCGDMSVSKAISGNAGMSITSGNGNGIYGLFGPTNSGIYAGVVVNMPNGYGSPVLSVGVAGSAFLTVQNNGAAIFGGSATFQKEGYFSGMARFDGMVSRTLGVSDIPGKTGNEIPNTAWVDKYYAASSWVLSTFGTQSWINSTFATQSALSNESSRAQSAESALNILKADRKAPTFTGGMTVTTSDADGKYLRLGDALPSGSYAALQMNLPANYGVNPIQIDKGGVQVFAIGNDNELLAAGDASFGGKIQAGSDILVAAGKYLYADNLAAKSAQSIQFVSPVLLKSGGSLASPPSDSPSDTGLSLANTGWVDTYYAPRTALSSEVSRATNAEKSLQGNVNEVSAATSIRVNGQLNLSAAQSSQRVWGLIINSGGRPGVWYGPDASNVQNIEVATSRDLSSEFSRATNAESALNTGKMDKYGGVFTGDVHMSNAWIYSDNIAPQTSGGPISLNSSVNVGGDIVAGGATFNSGISLKSGGTLASPPSDTPSNTGLSLANTGWVDTYYAPRAALSSEVSRATNAESALNTGKMDKYGGVFTGDVHMSNAWIYSDNIAPQTSGGPISLNSSVNVGGNIVAGGATFNNGVDSKGDVYVDSGKWLYTDAIIDNGSGSVELLTRLTVKGYFQSSNDGKEFSGSASSGYNPVYSFVNGMYYDGQGMYMYCRDNTPFYIGSGVTGAGIINFYKEGNGTSPIGSIINNGSSVQFVTTSDYRLKKNVETISSDASGNVLDRLRPVEFDWKSDGRRQAGFIAHELGEIIPQAVIGEKDAYDSAGNIQPQNVDISMIIPYLVAEVQALRREVIALRGSI